ncbi:GNAT family N-acetyltransferase [Arthrobacter sp. NEB 688]|uniref:GNAT family N-acetyltransferase n=1 Tax=Arthrobacter sp. NEB 688 TaxID=904039 RepID=UPI001565E32A|nr:GNAT family N-acetyltransferase [Arthrobacter sp. NEB 688]QKE84954.1 GNAT family N-acetyltransferase [Arthrobacter sp. NEB 688]
MTVRPATAADLPFLGPLEDSGDRQFAELFGGLDWPPADSGAERAAVPGFLLVATDGAQVVGFAHVLDLAGHWHLEQLSVEPGHQGRGHGGALLEAAVAGVRERGGAEVTLMTYADVPWNGPFYRRRGFVEIEAPARLAPMLATEERMGLARHGRRTAMVRPTR